MKAKLIVPLGGKTLELEGEGSPKAIVKGLAFWANLPTQCGVCDSGNISIYHKSPKGNDYFGLKCQEPNCGAELNFGQHKQGDSFFLKWDTQWEVWQPDADGKKSQKSYEDYSQDDGEESPF